MLVNDVGLDAIKKRVKTPLKGLKVAPYYGCQIVRPYATFDDQYNPTTMDRLLEALGGTVVAFPLKTRCCGGSLTGTVPEPGLRCSYILLKEAKKRGADVHRDGLPALPVQPRRLPRQDRGQVGAGPGCPRSISRN